jgi:hypothetical protein
LALFFFYTCLKGVVVKKKPEINNTSISDIIYLIMSNTGMTREQAAITVQNILTYMKEHTKDPLHKVVRALFGSGNGEQRATLN